MRKNLQLTILLLLLLFSACSSSETFKHGDIVITTQKCLSASSNENFNKLIKVSVRKDEDALKSMIASEQACVLPKNTFVEIKEMGFGYIEGEVVTSGVYQGKYVVIASEFVSKQIKD